MASTYQSYRYKDPFLNNAPGATAQKMAKAAQGKSAPTTKPKKNPFSGMSDAQIKAKYKGMSQADKKKFGMQMHTAAMANRKKGGAKAVSTTAQPSAKPKAAGTKPVNKVPQRFADGGKDGKYDKAVNKQQAKSNFFRSSSGTRGKKLTSNPKLKTQPPKSKLNRQQRRKLAITKKRGGTSVSDVASKISKNLRLTYKKGELVKRGNKVYRSDGRGNFTLVHRKQF